LNVDVKGTINLTYVLFDIVFMYYGMLDRWMRRGRAWVTWRPCEGT
jgi:hypothetical protein